jgi:hypothetical protein
MEWISQEGGSEDRMRVRKKWNEKWQIRKVSHVLVMVIRHEHYFVSYILLKISSDIYKTEVNILRPVMFMGYNILSYGRLCALRLVQQGPATCQEPLAFCPYVQKALSPFRHTKSSLSRHYKWLLRCRQQCVSHCIVHQAFYLANHSQASSWWPHLKFWIQEAGKPKIGILEFDRKYKPN